MNEFTDHYNQLLGEKFSQALLNLAQTVSKILMSMSKEEKMRVLKDQPDSIQDRVFMSAYEREDYEVCQVIKELQGKKRSGKNL